MDENHDSSESCYLLLKNLEEGIRKFIEEKLSENNPQWWKQRIPIDVKNDAKYRKEKDEQRKNWDYKEQPLISYIDFSDYEKIIVQKNNWNDIFKDVFRDKNAISVKLKEIEPIRNTIAHTRNLDPHEVKQIRFYSEDILRGISYYRKNESKLLSETIDLVEPMDNLKPTEHTVISVSFDRNVHPVYSTVHLRANVPELIPNEPVIFQIFNSKEKIIFERKIPSKELPNIELGPDARIYEISFIMNGVDWKSGEKYTLKGKHGTAEAIHHTRIEVREPIIQSDKIVYRWDSDMILTVIDPDADKDNHLVEYVGDRADAKLTIKSSKGKLENFKLRETGNSTGIFQGILGFIGVNKDGTKKPYDLKGTFIDTTQGHQIDDGFIEVSENDELEFTYTNATKTVTMIAFVKK